MEEKKTRGGAREGAGRKKLLIDGEQRTQHQMRATASEWEVVKAFAEVLKKDPERAKRMLATE